MGRSKVATLYEHDLEGKTAELWARDGITEVSVKVDGHEFDVPKHILAQMVGEHVRSRLITEIQEADAEDILAVMAGTVL